MIYLHFNENLNMCENIPHLIKRRACVMDFCDLHIFRLVTENTKEFFFFTTVNYAHLMQRILRKVFQLFHFLKACS